MPELAQAADGLHPAEDLFHETRSGIHAAYGGPRRHTMPSAQALGQSQAAFAAMLGVSPESYRTWDSGRRATPPQVMARARALATHRDDHELLPLPVLALLIGVHVKTLRAAARDGRLPVTAAREDPNRLWSLEALAAELGVHVRTLRNAARSGRLCVTFEPRVVFGHLVPRATLAAGRTFIERYYKQCYSRTTPTPTPPRHTPVPADWPQQLRQIRADLALTQTQLAQRIGAAGKAVIYQWESRKRQPSPVFWTRIDQLRADAAGHEARPPPPAP